MAEAIFAVAVVYCVGLFFICKNDKPLPKVQKITYWPMVEETSWGLLGKRTRYVSSKPIGYDS